MIHKMFTRPLFSFSAFLLLIISLQPTIKVSAQPAIAWQKSYGTIYSDETLQLFADEEGNSIVIGTETHEDFIGIPRQYMLTAKLDKEGNELWKTYHDVAFETFNPPLNFGLGRHFFTYEFGHKILNMVIGLNNQAILYKLYDSTGVYYSFETLSGSVIDVRPNMDRALATVQCSFQQACYGPDSLTVQSLDFTPDPDSMLFDPVKWTTGMKQNFRTTPIQGHYDFSAQDIRQDSAGNVYLLVQIIRWDFQFCTDCNDRYVDSWCEVFKFSPDGQFLKHKQIKVATAPVSSMGFVSFDEGNMVVRLDDINPQGNAVITSIYFLDQDLNVKKSFPMDRQYPYLAADASNNIFGGAFNSDPNDPDIHGQSDVYLAAFSNAGQFLWKHNYGGTDYDFIRGLAVDLDGEVTFAANTQSHDFDVAFNNGYQDIWVAHLSEHATSTDHPGEAPSMAMYPNPTSGVITIQGTEENMQLSLFDLQGSLIKSMYASEGTTDINLSDLPNGMYLMQVENGKESWREKLVKY